MAVFVEFKRPKGDPILLNVDKAKYVREEVVEGKRCVRFEMDGNSYVTLHDDYTYAEVKKAVLDALEPRAALP